MDLTETEDALSALFEEADEMHLHGVCVQISRYSWVSIQISRSPWGIAYRYMHADIERLTDKEIDREEYVWRWIDEIDDREVEIDDSEE